MTNDARNPYIDRGFVPTPEQYNLITGALTMLADSADAQNHPEVRPQCIKLIVALKQLVHAGEGMTPEVAERYGGRIAKAVAAGNAEAISRGLADLLAASLRLDADPAEKIGEMLAEYVQTSVVENSKALAVHTLGALSWILAAATEEWRAGSWPVKPEEVLSWVSELVALGAQNIGEGHAPWPDGEEDASAQAVAEGAVAPDTPTP